MSRVAVTGLGCVSVRGAGREELADAFARAEVEFPEIDRDQGYHLDFSARTGGLVSPETLHPWLKPMQARRMSPPSRLAVVASRIALADADLPPEGPGEDGQDSKTGVFLATAYGPSSYTERILKQIFLEGPQAVSPMLFTESVANAPAAQLALGIKATGPNVTLTQRDTGPLLAVAMARRALNQGRISRALVGGVDELNPLLHAVLDRFHSLARPRQDALEIARPFDRNRSGFIAGEGATVLVLEREEQATARKVPIRAIVGECVSAFDPTASAAGWGERSLDLARGLRERARRKNMPLSDIDLVVSGASGARAGDAVEASLLHELFGPEPKEGAPPVLVPKAWTGNFSGSLLAGAVLACEGARFAPTPGFQTFDPKIGLRPHDGSALGKSPSVLVQTAAVGGGASWLHLKSPEALLDKQEITR